MAGDTGCHGSQSRRTSVLLEAGKSSEKWQVGQDFKDELKSGKQRVESVAWNKFSQQREQQVQKERHEKAWGLGGHENPPKEEA